ncbi:MAG TPA: hypothetical protein PKC21_04520 [Oligoflexia bacterium]|nr:hypothetical protein [Oligoflexia bacterium]HMR24602.1 hypothetical protein [Oligoflexia bacterium]
MMNRYIAKIISITLVAYIYSCGTGTGNPSLFSPIRSFNNLLNNYQMDLENLDGVNCGVVDQSSNQSERDDAKECFFTNHYNGNTCQETLYFIDLNNATDQRFMAYVKGKANCDVQVRIVSIDSNFFIGEADMTCNTSSVNYNSIFEPYQVCNL